jgi:cytochrome P450
MDDLRLASIDVIASITFGTSFNSIRTAIDLLESDPRAGPSTRPPTPALARSLEQLLETIGDNITFPIPALLTWWTRAFDHKWRRARNLLYEFLEAKLDTAREVYGTSGENERRPAARLADNVLDMILESEREDHLKGEKALSRNEILDELATYALAGSESTLPTTLHHGYCLSDYGLFPATATSMQWAVKLLARHPHVQHKLHREVADKLPAPGQRVATLEEFSSTERLPYLSAVVYEVLRVSGTVPAVIRDTACDTTLLGYPVPKGVTVFMMISYAQRSESESYKAVSEGIEGARHESSRRNGRKYGYWADGDCTEFKPERWLTTDGVFNPIAGPWIPFSSGFRGCFGQKLAVRTFNFFCTMELLMICVSRVRRFLSCGCSWL